MNGWDIYLITLTLVIWFVVLIGAVTALRRGLRRRRSIEHIRRHGVQLSDNVDDVSAALGDEEAVRQVTDLFRKERP